MGIMRKIDAFVALDMTKAAADTRGWFIVFGNDRPNTFGPAGKKLLR